MRNKLSNSAKVMIFVALACMICGVCVNKLTSRYTYNRMKILAENFNSKNISTEDGDFVVTQDDLDEILDVGIETSRDLYNITKYAGMIGFGLLVIGVTILIAVLIVNFGHKKHKEEEEDQN